ncbi:MAG: hypothetical protein ACTH1D_03455 [Mycobacteriaceae bacterium]|uniref:hypothetical protein n=1 Tax=Corynebacterium sp. TaxID=1720 RepID=UPI003F9B36DA
MKKRTTTPVVLQLADPALADEVSMVVALTGRRLLRAGEIGTDAVILVTDADPGAGSGTTTGPGTDEVRLTEQDDRVTRVIRVSSSSRDGVLQIPEESTELAGAIGSHDVLDVAVFGVVGGAGASVFAAALAGVLADPGTGGPGQAALVDGDPMSRPGQLHLLLGLENSGDPWAGDVALVEDGSTPPDVPSTVRLPVVRDGGRYGRDPVTGLVAPGGGPRETRCVLVVPQTVPAVLAARHVLDTSPEMSVVLRELPRSGLTWNQTLTLLGRAPAVTWEDDPFLTVDIDRGDFRTTGPGAGTAATAAARLWEGMER